MVSEPAVSLYVISHNDGREATAAVARVLADSATDIEVVIADAGSSDDTREVLEQAFASDQRVRVVEAESSGAGHASNVAVSHCRAPLVARLRPNATFSADAFELLGQPFAEYPAMGVVSGGMEIVDQAGEPVPGRFEAAIFSRFVLLGGWIAHPLRLFRAATWKQTDGFAEDLRVDPEYDMYLKLAEVGQVGYVHEQITRLTFPRDLPEYAVRGEQHRDHMTGLNRAFGRRAISGAVTAGEDGPRLATAAARISVLVPHYTEPVRAVLAGMLPSWEFTSDRADPADSGIRLRGPIVSYSRAVHWRDRLAADLESLDASVELSPL